MGIVGSKPFRERNWKCWEVPQDAADRSRPGVARLIRKLFMLERAGSSRYLYECRKLDSGFI